ncbi:MAG: glycosyltransferase, partial [Ferruginibacter sp.]
MLVKVEVAMIKNKDAPTIKENKIMYIDLAYTLKMVNERSLHQELASRDSDGYFDHVWGIHPFADIPEKREPQLQGFKVRQELFLPNQTIIEGTSVYYRFLKKIYPLNFLVSQLRFLFYLVRLVKHENISIVLSTDPYFSGLLGLCIRFLTKAKLAIWVVANYDDIYAATGILAMPRLFRKRSVEKRIEKIVFLYADLVIGGNQNNLEYALRNGATIEKSTVFPVGKLIHRQHLLDPTLRDKDEIFAKINAKYHFVYIGRLTEIKYPDDVLKAFEVICNSVPDAALIIAGDGPMLEKMQKITVEMRLEDKVYFLGNISQERLANILG